MSARLEGVADRVAERRNEYMSRLERMVNVDCGSFTPEGVNRVADMCVSMFEDWDWSSERIAHRPPDGERQLGDLVIGRIGGGALTRTLMIGHTDTVFDDGTAAERPFRIEGDRAFGPGVSDMKAGLLTAFFAVRALQDAGARFGELTFVCNPDEEIGSPFSGPHIKELAAGADVALVFEGARRNGDIVSARKGVSDITVTMHGRAAHAGVEPEKGVSAILEAANKIVSLHALNGRWPGVTVNVGILRGGTRTNVVAERCELMLDLRAEQGDLLDEATAEILRICETSTVEGVTSEVLVRGWHRPMEKKGRSAELAELAKSCAKEAGIEVEDASTGGASDANTTSAAGVPTLDGLGPVGGDEHAPGEWISLDSVGPRIAMVAGMLNRLADGL
jgi:glutamate carboxypeptidase